MTDSQYLWLPLVISRVVGTRLPPTPPYHILCVDPCVWISDCVCVLLSNVHVAGVVVFGHLGDTRGRRLAVSCALVVVGVSTLLMAFLPTEGPSHSAVGGLWALLTALQSTCPESSTASP